MSSGFPDVGGFAVLSLHFVPEPRALALLGSGVLGLLVIGRRRIR